MGVIPAGCSCSAATLKKPLPDEGQSWFSAFVEGIRVYMYWLWPNSLLFAYRQCASRAIAELAMLLYRLGGIP